MNLVGPGRGFRPPFSLLRRLQDEASLEKLIASCPLPIMARTAPETSACAVSVTNRARVVHAPTAAPDDPNPPSESQRTADSPLTRWTSFPWPDGFHWV